MKPVEIVVLYIWLAAWFLARVFGWARRNARRAVDQALDEPLPPAWVNDGPKVHLVAYDRIPSGWAVRCSCGYRADRPDRITAIDAGADHHLDTGTTHWEAHHG